MRERAGHGQRRHLRGMGSDDRQESLPQRSLQPGGAAGRRAVLHDHGARRRDARSSIATTCAACRTTSPTTPSPAMDRCRRNTFVWTARFPATPCATRSSLTTTGCRSGGSTLRPGPPGCFRTGTSSGTIAPFRRQMGDPPPQREPRPHTVGVGRGGDAHDLQLTANGNHMIGAYVRQGNVDTSAYGGSRDATVINTELQEVSPNQTWSGAGGASTTSAGRRPGATGRASSAPAPTTSSTGTRSSRRVTR